MDCIGCCRKGLNVSLLNMSWAYCPICQDPGCIAFMPELIMSLMMAEDTVFKA